MELVLPLIIVAISLLLLLLALLSFVEKNDKALLQRRIVLMERKVRDAGSDTVGPLYRKLNRLKDTLEDLEKREGLRQARQLVAYHKQQHRHFLDEATTYLNWTLDAAIHIPQDVRTCVRVARKMLITKVIEDARRAEAIEPHTDALKAIIKSTDAFIEAWPTSQHSPFSIPFYDTVNFPQMCFKLSTPFNGIATSTMQECCAQFRQNVSKMGGVMPQEYRGDKPLSKYFAGFYGYQDILEHPVPFEFYDQTRFQHMHVLGDWGSTKTTFLSHLIMEDVARIPKVSVVVLDSQFRLIDGLAHLPNPKAILVGPSHPIGLNLFYLGNPDATADILTYAFGGIQNTEATALQTGPMRYIIKAVCNHPKPNLDVVQDFIRNPKKYSTLIAKCDKRTRDYFANDFNLRDDTKNGIVSRIALLREHAMLDKMLNADSLDLDLPIALAQGSLVLFDANKDDLGFDRSRVFGRLVIALINDVMHRRMKMEEEKLKRCFVFIDEAHDYIANDTRFVEMMEQARKQRIGICAAHHHDGQLSVAVKQSLERAAIQVECVAKGEANVRILKDRTKRISYDKFEFKERITDTEYAERYTRITVKEPPAWDDATDA